MTRAEGRETRDVETMCRALAKPFIASSICSRLPGPSLRGNLANSYKPSINQASSSVSYFYGLLNRLHGTWG